MGTVYMRDRAYRNSERETVGETGGRKCEKDWCKVERDGTRYRAVVPKHFHIKDH